MWKFDCIVSSFIRISFMLPFVFLVLGGGRGRGGVVVVVALPAGMHSCRSVLVSATTTATTTTGCTTAAFRFPPRFISNKRMISWSSSSSSSSSSRSTSTTSTSLYANVYAKDKTKTKAPIYITIGPPCCGKTTFLSQLQQKLSKGRTTVESQEPQIIDISLDDQDGVYLPVDVKYFLQNNKKYNKTTTSSTSRSSTTATDRTFYERRYIGKTLGFRIQEQVELCTVLQRLAGLLTPNEFQNSILQLYTRHIIEQQPQQQQQRYSKQSQQQNENDMTTIQDETIQQKHGLMKVAQDLIHVVEEYISQQQQQKEEKSLLPKKVDLFCVEALFRPHPKTNLTAVDAAAQQLKQYAMSTTTTTTTIQQMVPSHDIPLAWGNTNTRPREYKTALEAAVSSGRQVYFIVYYGNNNHNDMHRRISNGIFLPELEFQELVRRNLKRLIQTGKYIPVKTIHESSCRVQQLMKTCIHDLDRAVLKKQQEQDDDDGGDIIVPMHTKLDMDQRLVQMAHFEMKKDRTIRYAPPVVGASGAGTKKTFVSQQQRSQQQSPPQQSPPQQPTARRPQAPPPGSSSTPQLNAWRIPSQQHQSSSSWHYESSPTMRNPWNHPSS